MNNETTSKSPVAQPRLVRRWGGTDYPVIARLTKPYDLVAHPNGPAITDGDWISVMDIHSDDTPDEVKIKSEAQMVWRLFSWPLLRDKFYPANVEPYRRRGWSRCWFESVVLMPVGSGDLFAFLLLSTGLGRYKRRMAGRYIIVGLPCLITRCGTEDNTCPYGRATAAKSDRK